MAWSPQGDLIATGSNDKTVKLMRYNDDQKQLEGREVSLSASRVLCFRLQIEFFRLVIPTD
jgi:WD40 repeat protein